MPAAWDSPLPPPRSPAPPLSLDIHVNQIKAQASPMLHGLMTEEINYSYDGGLYGELVRNREFHAHDSWQTAIEGWKSVDHGGAESSFVADKTTGPSQAISYSVKLTVENAGGSARGGPCQRRLLGRSRAALHHL